MKKNDDLLCIAQQSWKKTIRIMKLTVGLLLMTMITATAVNTYSQNARISLNVKDATILDIFREIERNSEFGFFYKSEEMNLEKRQSIEVSQATIDDLLKRVLDENYSYKILDKNIVVTKGNLEGSQQQTKKISGRVTDQSGTTLPGVSVVVKGTTNGVITDMDGNFSLSNISENAILQFSFVGMKMQEIAVGSQTTINVVLADETIGIEEVVAVGYGTQKKVTVTGSVASLKGEDFNIAPVTNASNALTGRLPGVVAYQRSGEPGNDGTTIRIRGINTLGDNSPLVVVDGVPGRSLDRIDPNSIESVSVLKDASAAIYGSRAANGVILITTKRGKIGKPQFDLSLNQGFNQPTRIPEMANAGEYATMLNEIDTYRGISPRYSVTDLQKFRDGSDPWRYPNTNFFKDVMKPWSNQNNLNASITGGSEYFNYYISLGSIFQDGYYKKSSTFYKQYDFRTNIDSKISENIKIGFDVAGRMEYRNYGARSAGSVFRMLMRGKPIYPGYWPNGTPGPDLEYGDNPVVISTDATGYDRNKWYIMNSNLKLDIKIPWIKGLSFNANASIDKQFQFRKRFETPWYLYSWDQKTYDANNIPVLIKGIKGFSDPSLTEAMQDNQTILINGLLNYEKSFGKNNFKILMGMETIEGEGNSFDAYRRYFISTAIDQMFAGGDKDKNNGGSGYENARLNYFGRLNYNYSEKILLEFVGRYDGSYIFPEKGRYGFFPGVSIGWRMSEEDFWKENLGFIENFKLRGSWGQTGNDRIAEWQYLSTYATQPNNYTYIFGLDKENKLLSEARIPNPNVTWEVANQSNIGFDAQLLDNKLSVEFDLFDNRRSNILWMRNASVPGSTGLSLPRENIGKVKNQGIDFNIGYKDQISDFKYGITVNGGYAKNEITFWDEAPGVPEYQLSTGKPIPSDPNNAMNDLYYEAIGIFRDQAAIDTYPHWPGARPGDIIFRDVNDDKKIDGKDRVRNNKNNVPKFTGGVNLKLGYKNFDVSILFQGAAGAVLHTTTESGEIGNYLKSYYDNRWTAENPDAPGPRTNASTAEYWLNRNTYFLHKTDYIRLKNFEFGYSLPNLVSSKIGISNLRLYMSGYNLLTYSPDLKDFDPEIASESGQSYPVQRVINFGINASF